MKLTVTTTTKTYEGTPEEIRAVMPDGELPAGPSQVQTPVTLAAAESMPNMLDTFVRQVLARREVPHGQRDLLVALYEAGNDGLSKSDLERRIHRSFEEVNGVLGAFGKRINCTPGSEEVMAAMGGSDDGIWAGIGVFLSVEERDGQWHYALRPEIRRILHEEGSVLNWLEDENT